MMENNSNDGHKLGFGHDFGHLRGFVRLTLVMLSLFLVAVTVKEFKNISYVGRDVPAVTTITVSGSGEVVAIPDIATFNYTVEKEAATVSSAQEAATKTANAILASLKKSGIEDKDIKTIGYNIYPRYDYQSVGVICPAGSYCMPPSGKQVLAAYVVSQTVEVKVRKISDSGKILASVGELGATNLSGLNFSFDKDDSLKAEARTKAITDAKNKANELAKELGVRLTRIVNFSESGQMPIYYGKTMALGMGGADSASVPTPEISVGENKISSNVSITYEIR